MFRVFALGALALCAAAGAHAAAQRVEALTLVDPALRPVASPNSDSQAISTRRDLHSADGRFVLVTSRATDLDAAVVDLNGETDVWLVDTQENTQRLVSHRGGAPGATANGLSRALALSRDGNRALFASNATDLVAGQSDGNGGDDLFLFDRGSGETLLVSRSMPSATATANGESTDGMLDATGRRVAFRTRGTDLLPSGNDTNGTDDAYLFDSTPPMPTMRLLSAAANTGSQAGNALSVPVHISLDGEDIAVVSAAGNLVSGQVPGPGNHLFVMDRFGGARLVSHAAGAPLQEGNGTVDTAQFSDGGRFLVFNSRATNLVAGITDGNAASDVFLHDLDTATTTLVSSSATSATTTANGASDTAHVNEDGSMVAFSSTATNLFDGTPDNNGTASDVVLQAVATRNRKFVSAAAAGSGSADAPSHLLDIDAAGKRVLFESEARNLVAAQIDGTGSSHLFLFSASDGSTRLLSHRFGEPLMATAEEVSTGRLDVNGDVVVFSGPDELDATDDNRTTDVFVFRDGSTRRIVRPDPTIDDAPTDRLSGASVPTGGIDHDGRYVVFVSTAARLVPGVTGAAQSQLWLHDRLDRSATLVTHTPGNALERVAGTHGALALSADGEWLAYLSNSVGLVTASGTGSNAQLYLWQRNGGANRLASHAAGAPAVAADAPVTGQPSISDDGRFVAFVSSATNLVAGQTGIAANNLFLHDRDTDTVTLLSHAAGNPMQAAGGVTGRFEVSGDGSVIAFASGATDIAGGVPDPNGTIDVFLYVRASGANLPVSRSRSSARMALGGSFDPDVTADGNLVVLRSFSNELLPGPPTTGTTVDVYVWRRSDDSMRLISHHPNNAAQPSNGNALQPLIDDAGERIVFLSTATDLVPGFSSPHTTSSLFLHDGASDTIFLLDHVAGNAAQAADDTALSPVLARSGSHVAYTSRASNLVPNQIDTGNAVDMFLVDLHTRETFLASHRLGQPNVAALPNTIAAAVPPSLSGNGLVLGFATRGDDMVLHDVNDSDAFVYVHDEPTTLLIAGVDPEPARVGEPCEVGVELGAAAGPVTGHVTIDDGNVQCGFDLVATDDSRGGCTLVSTTPGDKTLTARFSSGDGFATAQASRAHTVLPPPQADLSIALQAPATVATGATFALRVDVANAGPDAAGEASVVFDGLPAVNSFSGAGWSCTSSPDFACHLDALVPGNAQELLLQLAAPDTDTDLALQAAVASAIADPDASDDSATATVQVDSAPQIAQLSPAGGGTEGGYPLQVSGANFGTAIGSVNLGGLPCAVTVWTQTQIVCSVPPGAGVRDVEVIQAATVLDRTTFSAFAYVAPDVDEVSPPIGDPAGGYPLVIEGSNFGAQDASVDIAGVPCTDVTHDAAQPHRRLTCSVPANTGSNLPVVVTQSQQSSDGSARFAYAAVVSDLLIAKSSVRSEVFSRSAAEWTILVSNLGPDTADGARVLDTLPAHLTDAAWTCTGLAGAVCRTAQGLGDIDVLLDLPVGGSALLLVSARIPRSPPLDLVNTASVSVPAGQGDPVSANDSDTETDIMATVFFDDFE